MQDPLNLNVHTDPLRARSPVTILATANVISFDADIITIGTAIAPPFGRAEQSYDRRAHGDCQVRRAGLAADINLGVLRQGAKPFQRY
jgi:hypothetical protein